MTEALVVKMNTSLFLFKKDCNTVSVAMTASFTSVLNQRKFNASSRQDIITLEDPKKRKKDSSENYSYKLFVVLSKPGMHHLLDSNGEWLHWFYSKNHIFFVPEPFVSFKANAKRVFFAISICQSVTVLWLFPAVRWRSLQRTLSVKSATWNE